MEGETIWSKKRMSKKGNDPGVRGACPGDTEYRKENISPDPSRERPLT